VILIASIFYLSVILASGTSLSDLLRATENCEFSNSWLFFYTILWAM